VKKSQTEFHLQHFHHGTKNSLSGIEGWKGEECQENDIQDNSIRQSSCQESSENVQQGQPKAEESCQNVSFKCWGDARKFSSNRGGYPRCHPARRHHHWRADEAL
jgi:hypothetical protein